MHKSQGAALLLDTEPARAVRCVQVFINASSKFVLEDLNDIAQDARGYREVEMGLGDVLDNRDLDQSEIIVSEVALLCLSPS